VIGAPELIALVLFAALLVYTLSGGADFGGGIWDLLARGARAPAQRALVERAIAPVWEANHVWLIVAVVLLFSAFPPAFAALSTRLHVPLVALLVGIVLRGSALVFRQYGGPGAAHRWQRVFAIASAATPFFLGAVLGAVTSGAGSAHQLMAWVAPLPLATGAAAVALCAYLAAVYLTVEASGQADDALAADFRRRALAAWVAVAVAALVCAGAAWVDAPGFARRLFGSAWSAPLVAAAILSALAALHALWRRRFRAARALAMVEASALLGGWGAAHTPFLIAPDMTVRGAAAPPVTLAILAPVLVVGAVIVLPALYWLMRVFKSPERPVPPRRPGDPRS
jgi:cytochrome d ubiquinol oxidase subunit II